MAKNLSRYHPIRGQHAYVIIDNTIETGQAPDYKAFILKITDFVTKVGGASSRPLKVFSMIFQRQDKEEPGQD